MPKAFLVRKQRILAAHAKEQAELAAKKAALEGGSDDQPLALVCPPVTPPASPQGQTGGGPSIVAGHGYPMAAMPAAAAAVAVAAATAQDEPLSLTTKRRPHEESEDELVIGKYSSPR